VAAGTAGSRSRDALPVGFGHSAFTGGRKEMRSCPRSQSPNRGSQSRSPTVRASLGGRLLSRRTHRSPGTRRVPVLQRDSASLAAWAEPLARTTP
jgi:hypothetical protein